MGCEACGILLAECGRCADEREERERTRPLRDAERAVLEAAEKWFERRCDHRNEYSRSEYIDRFANWECGPTELPIVKAEMATLSAVARMLKARGGK